MEQPEHCVRSAADGSKSDDGLVAPVPTLVNRHHNTREILGQGTNAHATVTFNASVSNANATEQ